jgi:hypothetical protein
MPKKMGGGAFHTKIKLLRQSFGGKWKLKKKKQ